MYSKFIHSDNALGNNCFIEYPPFILLSFLHPLYLLLVDYQYYTF